MVPEILTPIIEPLKASGPGLIFWKPRDVDADTELELQGYAPSTLNLNHEIPSYSIEKGVRIHSRNHNHILRTIWSADWKALNHQAISFSSITDSKALLLS